VVEIEDAMENKKTLVFLKVLKCRQTAELPNSNGSISKRGRKIVASSKIPRRLFPFQELL